MDYNKISIILLIIVILIVLFIFLKKSDNTTTQNFLSVSNKNLNNNENEIKTPAYNVCIGLLDAKTPEELQNIIKLANKTSSDNILIRDNSSLNKQILNNPLEAKQLLALELYPFQSLNQINTHDCLNDAANPNSCFQSPKLFEMNSNKTVKNNIAVDNIELNMKNMKVSIDANAFKKKYTNIENNNLINVETFTNDVIGQHSAIKAMISPYQEIPISEPLNSQLPWNKLINDDPILLANSPNNVNDRERFIYNDKCAHCEIGVCFNNYCASKNKLFL